MYNKKGQVFLIAAFIFAIAIYSVAIEYNTIKEYPALESYKSLSENYQTEYPKVVNYAIFKGNNITDTVDKFSSGFLVEAHKKDPNFGVFYVYKDSEGNIHIVNTLNNKVLNIKYNDPQTGANSIITLLSGEQKSCGEININGIETGSICTDIKNFDPNYYQNNERVLPNILKIEVVDPNGRTTDFNIDLREFSGLSYVQSTEQLDTTVCQATETECNLGQVAVTVVKY